MPIIDVNLHDLRTLLGKDVTYEELRERLPMMGTSWEGETDEGFLLEVFPNRPDLLSIEGLARAYAAFTGLRPRLRPYTVHDSNYTVRVDRSVEGVRPYFVSAVIKNVAFDDALIRSIMQLQEKLHVTHGRKRRKVSIGLHRLEVIQFPVVYTTQPAAFRFQPLDESAEMTVQQILTELPKGKEYAWIVEGFPAYPMLQDAKGMVLSMPPIINSEHTRIDEATTSIFVDITGTDLKAITETLHIIVTTFADRGGEIYAVTNQYPTTTLRTPDLTPRTMHLENQYLNALLGMTFTPKETAGYLERMGYGATYADQRLTVRVPSYRTDIMHPIDLVEDVAIAYGYDRFVPEIPAQASVAGEDPLEVFSRGLRNFLVGFGFLEVMTFMMSSREKLFQRMRLAEEPIAETENPKIEDYTVLRNRLLPSLLEVLSVNKHHPYPQNLYEVGDVVRLDPATETGARSSRRLAIVLCHAKANFSEIKGVLESLLQNLELPYDIEEGGLTCFIEGRHFMATVNQEPLCWAGEIHPDVLDAWAIEMPMAALELDVDRLFHLVQNRGRSNTDLAR